MGSEYMAVAVGAAGREFSGVIRINEAGSMLWKEIEKGITEDDLIRKMMDWYEDLDEETARADVKEFLDSIQEALENPHANVRKVQWSITNRCNFTATWTAGTATMNCRWREHLP